jgi:DNA repair exonuclease SbcCD ATPase subunit
MVINDYKQFAMQKRIELENLTADKLRLDEELEALDDLSANLTEGSSLVSQVGIVAQQEVNGVVEDVLTKALHAVFGDEFEFKMENEIKRGRPETTFYISERGKLTYLDDDGCGGGLTDLVSFCLRVVLWAIHVPRSAPILILDEPFKFIDDVRLEQAGQMVKELSRMMGIQFIIITHKDQMKDCADVMYSVEKIDGESHITCVKFEGLVDG